MPFAITKSCCTDAACVSVCPVACIHPAPGEPGFGSSEILHIDPASCIDCGACADACPVDAIYPIDRLGSADRTYAEINAAYYARDRELPAEAPVDIGPAEPADVPPAVANDAPALGYPLLADVPKGCRVAVVGTGPAGMYTLKELLTRTDARITVIDELPTPGGLVRSGVAPDHPQTKNVQRGFDVAMRHPRVSFLGGVSVGRDVTLDELRAHFDAVFLATGAQRPRRLGVPGEDLAGVRTARDLTAWAGGVPGWDDDPFAAGTRPDAVRSHRAIIVGTGNVALDVVRLFSLPTPDLERTDLATRALDVLRHHPVRDVVVLGRRTARDAAYTEAEFRALPHVPGLEVRTLDADEPFDSLDWTPPSEGARVTFLFGTHVQRFEPTRDGAAVAARLERAVDPSVIPLDADLVVTSLGHDVEQVEGLPYDEDRGTIANDGGRVTQSPGVYVVGWIKRGARGGIGTNRGCAQESVDAYLRDVAELPHPIRAPRDFADLLRERGVRPTDRRGATAIDRAELLAGARVGRPRVKLTTLEELRASAQTRRWPRRVS